MKHYKDDWAKSKSRDLLSDSIKRNLLSFMRPQDVKVLCFPGIDGAEITEVYDALGIPRANITGLEMKPEIAEQIGMSFPQIDLKPTSLEDFLKTTNARIPRQVLSLDFTSCTHQDMVETASKLGALNPANNYIFHVAMLAKREGRQAQDLMSGISLATRLSHMLGVNKVPLPDTFDMEKTTRLDTHRNHTLLNILSTAKTRLITPQANIEMLKRIMGNRYRTNVVSVINAALEDEQPPEIDHLLRQSLKMTDPLSDPRVYNLCLFSLNHFEQALMIEAIHSQLLPYFNRLTKEEVKGATSLLLRGSTTRTSGSYYIFQDYEKYAYISESGDPMMGDIGFLSNRRKIAAKYQELLDCYNPDTFEINNPKKFIKLFDEASAILKQLLPNGGAYVLDVPRQFLGNSAKPILTRRKAIELSNSGYSRDEILRTHRVKPKRLDAWRAHITMGTYEQDPPLTHEEVAELRQDVESRIVAAQEGISIGDSDSISKEDCLQYLNANIPPREIHEAFPATSLPTIHAWDFWRKRGNYTEATAT